MCINYTKTSSLLLVVTTLILNISACSLTDIKQQADKVDSIGTIKGKVKLQTDQSGAIIVNRHHMHNKVYDSGKYSRTNFLGHYQFDSYPGSYFISAFVDNNNDGLYQENEHANFYSNEPGIPAPISLSPGESVTVPDIIISGKLPALNKEVNKQTHLHKAFSNIGRIISLDDPMFKQSNYSMGMWKPLHFVEQIGGGLFMLQPYEKNKIPVIFVHGINGGPLDWKEATEGLNDEYFQPWILFYPSGVRLDIISDYMVQALLHLQDKHSFEHVFIAAHSMGGLVARSTVKKYFQKYPEMADSLDLLITVNSPLKGMKSAELGVNNSPIVLPVWRDLAPGSKFLHNLNNWFLPETIPYHLVFSFKTDSTGDGVVTLQSQLPFEVQQNAVKLYGFNNSHVGTLKDKVFLDLFNSILDKRREEMVTEHD